MLQGFLTGGGAGGGGQGWFNLSAYWGTIGLLSGAPSHDPLAQWVSGSSDPSGTTMTVLGTLGAGTNIANLTHFVAPLPIADILPGMVWNGTAALELRITTVTDATADLSYYQMLAFGPAAAITTSWAGLGYYAGGGAAPGYRYACSIQATTLFTANHLTAVQRRAWMPVTAGGFISFEIAGTQSATGPQGEVSRAFVGMCAGCRNVAGAPQSAKLLWEIRGVSWF